MKTTIEMLAFLINQAPDDASVGEIARLHGETTQRVMDAMDVLKIMRGQPTQIPPVPWGLVDR